MKKEMKKVISDESLRHVITRLADVFEKDQEKKYDLLKITLLSLSDYVEAGGTMESFISGAEKIFQEVGNEDLS